MIFVPDIAAAKRFYGDVLGFGIGSETNQSLEFTGAGCRFQAFKCARPAISRDYSVEAQPVFVFEVPNLDRALEELSQHGVRVLHSAPGVNSEGRYAAFMDPFGIVHEILEPHTLK